MIEEQRFKKLLVANRGEIACRILLTAQQMGIASVAIYSEPDAKAYHVELADESYFVGPAPAAESYLAGDKIIGIARECGADAIHPGYGFLSENADFAESCAEAGIIFVGPSPEAIRIMGLKGKAKEAMKKAGLPVLRGYNGSDQSTGTLLRHAEFIGFPLMIKAVAGGGGKGMRLVESMEDFEAALGSARREAEKAFGNDEVLLEKFLPQTRHIEVQIMGDSFGNVLHLFERDCSLQRRHQKIIEEAPAPGMTEGLREKMCQAAVSAAKAINYQSAGTVEFLVDATRPLSDDSEFYFMEMNTRLQVEHPVTEQITGFDMVQVQLDLAIGKELPFPQEMLSFSGHAMEVRVYAEDPEKDFLPQTGKLKFLRWPSHRFNIRFDSGVVEGDVISPHYDPMIAKLISRGNDRRSAINHMVEALKETRVGGCKTNLEFLLAIFENEDFVAAKLDTGFLDGRMEELTGSGGEPELEDFALAALAFAEGRKVDNMFGFEGYGPHSSPWNLRSGWRLNLAYRETVRFVVNGKAHEISLMPLDDAYRIEKDGKKLIISGQLDWPENLSARIGGREIKALVANDEGRIVLVRGVRSFTFTIADAASAEEAVVQGPGAVAAPMPGRILKLMVKKGETVENGQPLLIMEAMKMEYTLTAPCSGRVAELRTKKGDQVEDGQPLVTVTGEE